MIDDLYFRREATVDIDAAVVGIGIRRWTFLHEQKSSPDLAKQLMQDADFDVLPIGSKSLSSKRLYVGFLEATTPEFVFREFYQTDVWNDYSSISKRQITYKDVIPLKTSIRNVIKGFATESRSFYFLENETRIAGLISIANLNSTASCKSSEGIRS